MGFLIIFQQSVLPLFIIIGVALIYNRFFNPDIRQITSLTLTVFAPVFVFDAVVKQGISLSALKIPFAFMVALTGLLLVISYFAGRLLRFAAGGAGRGCSARPSRSNTGGRTPRPG